jgi:hypothetical protein
MIRSISIETVVGEVVNRPLSVRPRLASGLVRRSCGTESGHWRMLREDAESDAHWRCARIRGQSAAPPGAARMSQDLRTGPLAATHSVHNFKATPRETRESRWPVPQPTTIVPGRTPSGAPNAPRRWPPTSATAWNVALVAVRCLAGWQTRSGRSWNGAARSTLRTPSLPRRPPLSPATSLSPISRVMVRANHRRAGRARLAPGCPHRAWRQQP